MDSTEERLGRLSTYIDQVLVDLSSAAPGLPSGVLTSLDGRRPLDDGDDAGVGIYVGVEANAQFLIWLDAETLNDPSKGLIAVAAILQDWVLEELPRLHQAAVWPVCPWHPGHPVEPALVEGAATWVCLRLNQGVAPIGALGERTG